MLPVFLLLAFGVAAPAQEGDKLLASVEESLSRAKTLLQEFDLVHQEPGKAERKLALISRLKGESRLLEFTAPKDLAGTKFLSLSPTQMYVYLPAFGKVRRVAARTSEGFLGLAFSTEDLTGYRHS